jgi:hypothetical protein
MIGILYREPFIHARALFSQISLAEALDIQKTAARNVQEIISSMDVGFESDIIRSDDCQLMPCRSRSFRPPRESYF